MPNTERYSWHKRPPTEKSSKKKSPTPASAAAPASASSTLTMNEKALSGRSKTHNNVSFNSSLNSSLNSSSRIPAPKFTSTLTSPRSPRTTKKTETGHHSGHHKEGHSSLTADRHPSPISHDPPPPSSSNGDHHLSLGRLGSLNSSEAYHSARSHLSDRQHPSYVSSQPSNGQQHHQHQQQQHQQQQQHPSAAYHPSSSLSVNQHLSSSGSSTHPHSHSIVSPPIASQAHPPLRQPPPPPHRISVHVEEDEDEDNVSVLSVDPLNQSQHVEQQMDMEVERVLREWDTNVQRRTQDTFSLRPKSNASINTPTNASMNASMNASTNASMNTTMNASMNALNATNASHHGGDGLNNTNTSSLGYDNQQHPRRQHEQQQHRSLSNSAYLPNSSSLNNNNKATFAMDHDNTPPQQQQRRHFEFPEIDVIRRQDTSYDTHSSGNAGNETFEEDPRTPLYVYHPLTGQRLFHIDFDMTGYDERNVTVKVSGNRLVVHAIQNHDGVGKKSSTEFCRKIRLPHDVDKRLLMCNYNNDTSTLNVEAPLLTAHTPTTQSTGPRTPGSAHISSAAGTPTFPVTSPRPPEILNTPVIKPEPNGTRQLHLAVEVGKLFKSGDVVVKVRGQNKVLVNAERDESNSSSKLSAKLTREFDLSHKVDPHTLKAGLTAEGLLRITALVLEDGSDAGSSAAENTPNMNVRTEID